MDPTLHCLSHQLWCSFLRSFYKTISSCAILPLLSHQFFCSLIETLASPSEYLCLHGLTIKTASLCFHFLSDSGNPDQGLELWPWLYHNICPATSCYQWLHKGCKQRHPRLSGKQTPTLFNFHENRISGSFVVELKNWVLAQYHWLLVRILISSTCNTASIPVGTIARPVAAGDSSCALFACWHTCSQWQ